MLRSSLAILVGLAAFAAVGFVGLSLAGPLVSKAASAGWLPGGSAPYLLLVVILSAAAGFAGVNVTGRLARSHGPRPVGILAALVFLWSVLYVIMSAVPASLEAFWFALLVGVASVVGVLLGVALVRRT